MTTPTKSISERVIDAVIARLEKVKQANDYRTDAGIRVFYARRTISEADLPCFVVWDGGENVTNGGGSGPMTMKLTVNVDAHCMADQGDTGAALQMLKADAKRALLLNSGGIVDDDSNGRGFAELEYNQAQTDARRDGNASESVSLTLTANYKENYGDPYASR